MIFELLAIYAISYIFRNLDGPFDILNYIRRELLDNKYIGVFVYKLISCPWCVGFHSGYLVYLLSFIHFNIFEMIVYGFAGSAITYFGDEISEVFQKFKNSET